MAIWYISKSKRKLEGVENVIPISLEKWRDYVDSDSELFWFEDTPLGQESLKVSKDNNLPLNIKTFAHMDFNKKYGHGNVQLNYLNQDGSMILLVSGFAPTPC